MMQAGSLHWGADFVDVCHTRQPSIDSAACQGGALPMVSAITARQSPSSKHI